MRKELNISMFDAIVRRALCEAELKFKVKQKKLKFTSNQIKSRLEFAKSHEY